MNNRKPSPGEKSNISVRIMSGCIGSLVTSLVVTPLDVVKVRLQANTADGAQAIGSRVVPCPRGCGTFVLFNGQMECVLPRSAVPFFDPTGHLKKPNLSGASELGTFAMVRRIFATEGLRGIYAGLSPTLVMAVPNTVFYYSSYDEIVWRLRQSSEGNWIPLVAGASARLMASTVTAPFEKLRTLQASIVGRSETAPGLWEHMRLIVKKEGVGSLYHGLGSTLWRDVPFSAIYWYSLERTKSRIQSGRNLTPIEQSGVTFVSGAISGLIAAAATTPMDVVKTKQQAAVGATEAAPALDHACCHDGARVVEIPSRSASTLVHMRHILETEGITGLWRGNHARMLKVAPGCAIMISTYELGKRILASD